MKTTIKGAASAAIVVQPGPAGTVALDLTVFRVGIAGLCLTPDQVGALLFGLESAAEASRIAQERAASIFNNPDADTPFPALGGDPEQAGGMNSMEALAYLVQHHQEQQRKAA